MTNSADLERKLWSSMGSHPVMMLGVLGEPEGPRPMTARVEETRGPLWFFSVKDSGLFRHLSDTQHAVATYVSKSQDIFASLEGLLVLDNDQANIERLWNPFVAAWYDGGKEDPRLALMRFEPASIHIWLDDSNLVTDLKILMGADPKRRFADHEATIRL
jgi:general stress protein 26